MKIKFDNQSYINIYKTSHGMITVIIQAKDEGNHLKRLTTCVELTEEQYKKLISDI